MRAWNAETSREAIVSSACLLRPIRNGKRVTGKRRGGFPFSTRCSIVGTFPATPPRIPWARGARSLRVTQDRRRCAPHVIVGHGANAEPGREGHLGPLVEEAVERV